MPHAGLSVNQPGHQSGLPLYVDPPALRKAQEAKPMAMGQNSTKKIGPQAFCSSLYLLTFGEKKTHFGLAIFGPAAKQSIQLISGALSL